MNWVVFFNVGVYMQLGVWENIVYFIYMEWRKDFQYEVMQERWEVENMVQRGIGVVVSFVFMNFKDFIEIKVEEYNIVFMFVIGK